MTRLSVAARDAIRASGLTVAEYQRHWGSVDGGWHGDTCGCIDDRCVGHHHGVDAECGCLLPCIDEVLKARARIDFTGWHPEVRVAFVAALRALQREFEAECRQAIAAGALGREGRQDLFAKRLHLLVASSTASVEISAQVAELAERAMGLPLEQPAVAGV